ARPALLDAARAAHDRPGRGLRARPADGRGRLDAPGRARARVRARGLPRAELPRAHPHLPPAGADAARGGHLRALPRGARLAEPRAWGGLPGLLVPRLAGVDLAAVGARDVAALPPGRAAAARGVALVSATLGHALRDQAREIRVFQNRIVLSGLLILIAF